MEERSDEALLAATAAGDAGAFDAFYRRHVRRVLAYLAARTSDPELAADLTAETFAAALEGVGRFDPARGSGVAWLFGIARHQAQRAQRRGRAEDRARRRLEVAAPALDAEAARDVTALAAEDRGPEALAALAGLPPAHRAAVRARVLHDRPYEDIARQQRATPALVRQRVARGLAAMRARLGGDRP
jgi:RNA polymerase sigma factor (sigma-70 family)